MKHIYLFPILICCISCGQQTETRAHMDTTGNRMSDSLQRIIDSSLTAPARELSGTGSPIASGASTFSPMEASK